MVHFHATWILASLVTLLPGAGLVRAEAQPLSPSQTAGLLRAGDRVAMVGDVFFEREYQFGLIETALTLAHREKALTFRSLGWSGDTVWGEARAYRGEPKDGYAELMKSLDLTAPTVIFVGYGANESFAGDQGLSAFLEQYRLLLDDLTRRTPRVVLVTPLPHEAASSPLPSSAVEARNQDRARYVQAIRALAQTRGLVAIDLFATVQTLPARAGQPLFQNGVHLSEGGYTVVAAHLAAQTLAPDAVASFFLAWHGTAAAPDRPLSPSTQSWAPLRELVVDKNDAFFHRWRPANAAYIYLSRRGGQNTTAQEIPQFDPVLRTKEQDIARLLATLPWAQTSPEGSRR